MEKDIQGYKKLDIYIKAHDLAVKIHKMTLGLPDFEMAEEGRKVRISSKTIVSNIVEGYALRQYKQDYVHYLNCALAASIETLEHLDFLMETGSLKDRAIYQELYKAYTNLNGTLFSFIESI